MNNVEGVIEKHIKFSDEEEKDLDINRNPTYFGIKAKNDPDGDWNYDTHLSLIDKLPGYKIIQDEFIASHVYQAFSFLKIEEIIYCFKLETDNSEPSSITYKTFNNVSEFYLYLFNNNLMVPIELCAYLKIITPKDVFLNYLKSRHIYLLGYKTSMDFEGYDTMSLWLVKKHTDANWSWVDYHFNAKDYEPDNSYFGVDGWANIIKNIIDDKLLETETEKPKPFNLILEELTDQNLRNFHRNKIKPYESADEDSVSYLNSVLVGSSSNVNW